jgi:hypothetical protein
MSSGKKVSIKWFRSACLSLIIDFAIVIVNIHTLINRQIRLNFAFLEQFAQTQVTKQHFIRN